jgi:hypothetical protein
MCRAVRAGRFFSLLFLFLLFCTSRLPAATSIPFRFRDGMIWVKVAVTGHDQPLSFLLDSGAGVSVVDLAAAHRLGLPFGERQNVEGVYSRTAAYPVPASMLAVDLGNLRAICHQRVDGLLGADFFRNHIVQVDFAAQTIRLLQRSEVDAAGCEVLPLEARNDTFCTRVSVDGNPPEWLRLDTGCSSALEWVVADDRAKKLGGATKGTASDSIREVETDVRFGAKRIGAVKTGLHTARMFAGEAGLIGNGLLSRFTVTIDLARRCCLLASR